LPNAAIAVVSSIRRDRPGYGFPRKNMFNKKNFIAWGVIALVAIIAVKVVYPLVQPTLAKIPVVGNWFTA
jgi:hypothetical protein